MGLPLVFFAFIHTSNFKEKNMKEMPKLKKVMYGNTER